jgi:hypothetical protein
MSAVHQPARTYDQSHVPANTLYANRRVSIYGT